VGHHPVTVFVINIIVLGKHMTLELLSKKCKIASKPLIENCRIFAVFSFVSKSRAVVLGDETFILYEFDNMC
jgi:hypothetical protein